MGVDIGREKARRAMMRWSDTSRFNPDKFPSGVHVYEPPYVRVETYSLGDWLYNRGRAISDLVRAELSWRYYLNRQPPDVQEAVAKLQARGYPDYFR